MSKKLLIIIGIIITITAIGSGITVYSKYDTPKTCQEAVLNEIEIMRNAWLTNLTALKKQEKSTSGKSNEGVEGLRTYNCWLKYLCEAVKFSGNTDTKLLSSDKKLTSDNIKENKNGGFMGCGPVDKIVIPGTQIKYIPQCKTSSSTSSVPVHQLTTQNFTMCTNLINMELNFNPAEKSTAIESSSVLMENFKNRSAAYIILEKTLKQDSADQKSRIVTSKLKSIVDKMQVMEIHMSNFNKYMSKLDQRLTCIIEKCD